MSVIKNESSPFVPGKIHMEMVKASLGSKMDSSTDEDLGALIRAAMIGSTYAVMALLEKGIDVNARDINGRTALIEASFGGHLETVKALLVRGADANAQDNDGWTALMEAASKGHTDVVRTLIDAGADTRTRNKDGWTALKATARSNTTIIRMLKSSERVT